MKYSYKKLTKVLLASLAITMVLFIFQASSSDNEVKT